MKMYKMIIEKLQERGGWEKGFGCFVQKRREQFQRNDCAANSHAAISCKSNAKTPFSQK